MCRPLGMACGLGVVLSLAGARLHAQPPAEKTAAIEKVLADWKHRLDQCKSVRYVVSGKTEKKDLPKKSKAPAVRPVKFVVLLDVVRGRVRIEHEGSGFNPDEDRYVPRVSVSAYGGKSYQLNSDRKLNELGPTNADIFILKGSLHTCTVDNELFPLLCAHGIIPTSNKPPRVDRLLKGRTAEEFDSRGEIKHAESRCLVLRTDPAAAKPFLVDELWVDPSRESAVARQVCFGGTNPWFRFDAAYRKSDHGWLPASWTFAHTIGGRLIEVSRFTVESMEIDPAITDEDFTLPTPPGSIVSVSTFPKAGQGLDPHKPASGTFRIDSAGKWIPLKETGFTTGDGRQLPPESPGRGWLWWGGAALVGVVAVATVVVLYRRRKRRFTKG